MPTATTLSGARLINNGPLTTTFTAPSSCSTDYAILIGLATEPTIFEWIAQCNYTSPADCNPSGAALQSLVTANQAGDPRGGFVLVYHSPGVVCPAGWATVGAAVKASPSSLSISGAFNVSSAVPTGAQDSFFENGLDVFLDALDPGETAVLCCPSTFTALNGGCYSNFPSSVYTPTVGCERIIPSDDVGAVFGTWTIGGQTVTAELETITATTPISTRTTVFAPSEATSYVGVAATDIFILVHQASDTGKGGAASTTTSKPNSAVRMRGSEKRIGVVAAVYCLSLAVEALLIG